MSDTDVSYEKIDALNLAGAARYAQLVASGRGDLPHPVEDLELFSRTATDRNMLDIGCGWGHYVHKFIKAGFSYVGVDSSPEMLQEARKRNPDEHFYEASYLNLEGTFAPNRFDAIWSCCAFGGEPKARMPQALAQLRRVLLPGGVMVIVLANNENSEECLAEGAHGEMYYTEWFADEFKQTLQHANFVVEKAFKRFRHGSMTFIARKPPD